MVICAKTAEPIEMPFGLWVGRAQGIMCYTAAPVPMGMDNFKGQKGRPLVKYIVTNPACKLQYQ